MLNQNFNSSDANIARSILFVHDHDLWKDCDRLQSATYAQWAEHIPTPEQEYKLWSVLKKYRRTLKSKGLEFPKEYECVRSLEQLSEAKWRSLNLSKGTEYIIERDGLGLLSCSCPAAKYGNYCSHMEQVEAMEHQNKVIHLAPEPPPSPVVPPPPLLPELLPGLTATEEQAGCLEALQDWLWIDRSESMFLLKGSAGTGKSTLLQALVLAMQRRSDHRRVCFVAPTNDAVRVLDRMLRRWNIHDIHCMTIASLLALKPCGYTADGAQEFGPAPNKEPKLDDYDLISWDEGSWIGRSQWENILLNINLLSYDKKHLFLGDYAQVTPVGEDESPIWSQIPYGFELNNPVRYSGAIARDAWNIRNNLHAKALPLFESDFAADKSTGVWVLSREDWNRQFIRAVAAAHESGEVGTVRALSWRRKNAYSMNRKAEASLYGFSAPIYKVGDTVIAQEPFMEGDQIAIGNATHCKILSIRSGTLEEWKVIYAEVLTEDGELLSVPILDPSESQRFTKEQSALKKAKQYRRYWLNQGRFAWFEHCHAGTVHRAQGSTIENVFIDLKDIKACKEVSASGIPLRNRLAYTALTRAQKRVIITQ